MGAVGIPPSILYQAVLPSQLTWVLVALFSEEMSWAELQLPYNQHGLQLMTYNIKCENCPLT